MSVRGKTALRGSFLKFIRGSFPNRQPRHRRPSPTTRATAGRLARKGDAPKMSRNAVKSKGSRADRRSSARAATPRSGRKPPRKLPRRGVRRPAQSPTVRCKAEERPIARARKARRILGELVSTETAALFFRRLRRRDSPRVAEATAECRQRAQADTPRAATALMGLEGTSFARCRAGPAGRAFGGARKEEGQIQRGEKTRPSQPDERKSFYPTTSPRAKN